VGTRRRPSFRGLAPEGGARRRSFIGPAAADRDPAVTRESRRRRSRRRSGRLGAAQGRAEAGQVTGCRHSVPNCVPGNPFSVGHVSYLTANPTTILVSSGVAHPALNGTETMPKVTVFKIKCFDAFMGEERILRCMATRSGARLLGGGFEIIEGTAIEVDASQLERGEPWTGVGFHAPGSAQATGSVNIR
jgi:hypothetical protein